jgi:hypothetical protein
MLNLSREERERWIEALSSRFQRHAEILIDIDTTYGIESEVGVMDNQEEPVSARRRDYPHDSRPVPPPTNQGIEENL